MAARKPWCACLANLPINGEADRAARYSPRRRSHLYRKDRVVSFPSEASAAFGAGVAAERTFLRQVFAWMFLALALTTGVAIWFHQSDAALNYFASHQTLFWVALIGQLAMVFAIRAVVRSPNVSVSVAALLFFVYAAITGLVFSILLDVYTTDSVVGAFAGATGVFGGMAVVGYTTQTDLSRFRGILFGALIGLIAASVAFVFTGGSAFNLVIGFAGVLIFSGLTAYDIQQIKLMQIRGVPSGATADKLAIFGALRLYLDFVNLFISLLRIFGGARR
jgi:FtsH-binding integral membrane protein